MPGSAPGFLVFGQEEDVGGRDKPAHDEVRQTEDA